MKEKERKLTERSIARNLFSLGVADILNKLLPLITFPYVVRVMGPEAFGTANFGLAYVSFFLILVDFGLNIYAVREISVLKVQGMARLRGFINEIFTAKMLLLVVTLIFYFTITSAFPFSFEKKMVIYLFGSMLVYHAFDFQWLLQGTENLGPYSVGSIISNIIKIGAIFIFVHSPDDLLIYVMIVAASSFIIILVESLYLFHAGMRIRTSISKNVYKHMIRAFPLAVSIISIMIYTRSDTLMLSFLKDDSIVGIYNAGYYIVFGALSLLTMVNTVFFPVISKTVNSCGIGKRYQIISMRIMLLVGFSLFIFFFIFSREALDIILGDQYERTLDSFRILIFIVPLIALSYIFGGQILLSRGKFKTYSLIILSGGVLNIILNFILIPLLSEVGAAAATLVTEMMVASLTFYISRKFIRIPFLRSFLNFLLIFILLLSIKLILFDHLPMIIIGILVSLIYVIFLFLSGSISLKSIRTILKLTFESE